MRASYLLQSWSTWVHHLNGPLILSCFWLDEIKRVTCRYSLSPHLVLLFLKMAKRHLWCHKVLICGSSLQHLTLSLRHSMALALKHATSQTQFAAHSRNILISEPGIPNSNRLGVTSNLKQKIQPPCQCTAINPEKTKKGVTPTNPGIAPLIGRWDPSAPTLKVRRRILQLFNTQAVSCESG